MCIKEEAEVLLGMPKKKSGSLGRKTADSKRKIDSLAETCNKENERDTKRSRLDLHPTEKEEKGTHFLSFVEKKHQKNSETKRLARLDKERRELERQKDA